MKKFNTTCICFPEKHYTMDISGRLRLDLKIWRGNSYNERGEKQLAEYLDYFHLETGYLVSFCFNKSKQSGTKEVMVDERKIYEAVV